MYVAGRNGMVRSTKAGTSTIKLRIFNDWRV